MAAEMPHTGNRAVRRRGMVKELQKKFIKTTMLVVTILLAVFLAALNIVNFSLSRRDNRSTMNQIIAQNLAQLPGDAGGAIGSAGNAPGTGQTGPGGVPVGNSEMEPLTEMDGTVVPALGPEPMTEADGTPVPAPGSEPMTEADGTIIPVPGEEAMTEMDRLNDGLRESRQDLGRYFIARINAHGAITFYDLSHAGDVDFSTMVDLINKANVSFAPEVTGETETEPAMPGNALTAGGPAGSAAGTVPADGGPAGNAPDSTAPVDGGPAGNAPDGTAPADGGPGAAEGEPPADDPASAGDGDSGIDSQIPQRTRGQIGGYMYYAVQRADGTVNFAFLNISESTTAIVRILLLTVALGVGLWLLILLLVVFLSKKAIAPIAANIERQRQFITDASHEIKTPLAVIVSNVDVQELHSGKTKWLDNIRAQALRLSDLTKQMLTLSKMEEGSNLDFVSITFDASKEVEDTVRLFRESALLRGIEVRTDIEPRVQIHFPKEQFQKLLELLLDNAVKYAKENGFIEVSLHPERKFVVLRMRNNCDALPDIDPDRLFDRFYRADASRSRQAGGSGIGLAVVRAIAEHEGGKAHAHFLPDEVIEFEIELPR